ncbi:MAG: hypothetical protein ABI305_06455 [Tepidiformaceae bacterium]
MGDAVLTCDILSAAPGKVVDDRFFRALRDERFGHASLPDERTPTGSAVFSDRFDRRTSSERTKLP